MHSGEPDAGTQERPVFFSAGIDRLFNKKSGLILLITLLCIVVVVFRHFLFLEKVYLYKDIASDSINDTYPTLFHIVDYLRTTGIPKWSFNQGLGQSLFTVGTFDPFLLLFYALGSSRIAPALAFVEILKIVLGGVFFFLYLKQLPVSNYSALIGGVLYSFTGYMIVGSAWYWFSYDALCIALLLYAVEKLFQQNVWYLLPIPIALTAAYQPFQLLHYGLLLFVYAHIRCPRGRDWEVKYLAAYLFRLIPPCLLGLGLSSVFLFSNISQILQSPRVGGDASYVTSLSSQPLFGLTTPDHYVSEILRLFSSDLMGTGNHFKGWGNYLEAPLLYTGLVTLLLAPQFFSFLDRKRKAAYALLVGSCFIPLIFPVFRYAFWFFAGDYFRVFSFFISLVLLYLAIRGLSFIDQHRRVSLPTLFLSLAGALAVLYVPSSLYERYTEVQSGLRAVITVFLFLYTFLIMSMRSERYFQIARVGILLTVTVEAAYLSNIAINQRDVLSASELEQRTGYNDYTVDALALINSRDKEFFRIHKDYSSGPSMSPSLNDGKVQGYRGISSYHSFNQNSYIRFLQALDTIPPGDERRTRWAEGLAHRPILQTLVSVKYALTKKPEPNAFGPSYERLADFNDVHAYKNRDFLPLGFCYDTYMPASRFAKLAPEQKDRALLETVVIEDIDRERLPDFTEFEVNGESDYSAQDYENDIRSRRRDTLTIQTQEQNHIRGTVSLVEKKVMFFSVPFDEGWSVRIDGKQAKLLLVDKGFLGLILERGTHTVELDFEPPYLISGAGASLLSLFLYGFVLFRSRRRGPA